MKDNQTTIDENSNEKTFSFDDIPEEVKIALKKSIEYFDKNPPRASTKEEIDEFFKQFK